MAGLASALAERGLDITYVAERPMSEDRAAQGWQPPDLGAARLRLAPDAQAVANLVNEAPERSVHICQGMRGNGLVGVARAALARRGLLQWVVMETVEDSGWCGALKRLEYRRLVRVWRDRIEGGLAIGHVTATWLAARGMPAERIFPFAYFLPDRTPPAAPEFRQDKPFRILFVGRIIKLKRLDLLIDVLARFDEGLVELIVIGSGPLDQELRVRAETRLGGHVTWLGRRPHNEIPGLMAQADCLVLPSRYDGWGAVVSEALMAGTPAICSDRCGALGVVLASGCGGVFPEGDATALEATMRRAIGNGRQTPDRRASLAAWAHCLGARAGAAYLHAILDRASTDIDGLAVPWLTARTAGTTGEKVGQ